MAIDNTVWGATPPTVRACVETMWNRGRAPVSGSTTKLKQYATVRPARISIASPHQHQHFHLSIVEILTRLLCNHNYQRRGQKRGRMLKNTHNDGDREKMAKLKKIIIKKRDGRSEFDTAQQQIRWCQNRRVAGLNTIRMITNASNF
jgi:hypothetical protein